MRTEPSPPSGPTSPSLTAREDRRPTCGRCPIAAREDKIVQQAARTVLECIYEQDFLGVSYGFRPGRSQHQALDALYVGITKRKVNWMIDADIRGFFDNISHEWLLKFLERPTFGRCPSPIDGCCGC